MRLRNSAKIVAKWPAMRVSAPMKNRMVTIYFTRLPRGKSITTISGPKRQ